MMNAGGRNALAFAIRNRGRAELAPISPAVTPARQRLTELSPIDPACTMPIRDANSDTFFHPPQPSEGCLFLVVFGVAAAAFVFGVFALLRVVGG